MFKVTFSTLVLLSLFLASLVEASRGTPSRKPSVRTPSGAKDLGPTHNIFAVLAKDAKKKEKIEKPKKFDEPVTEILPAQTDDNEGGWTLLKAGGKPSKKNQLKPKYQNIFDEARAHRAEIMAKRTADLEQRIKYLDRKQRKFDKGREEREKKDKEYIQKLRKQHSQPISTVNKDKVEEAMQRAKKMEEEFQSLKIQIDQSYNQIMKQEKK